MYKSLTALLSLTCLYTLQATESPAPAQATKSVVLKSYPRLSTEIALQMLIACHTEIKKQKVKVAVIILGSDGRIIASSRHENMGPNLYDFAHIKANTSYFRGVDSEEHKTRTAAPIEVIDIKRHQVLRGAKGAVPLLYKGHVIGAIGVSGAHPDIDKIIALAGQRILTKATKKEQSK